MVIYSDIEQMIKAIFNRHCPFGIYAKFSEKRTFLSPRHALVFCVYQWIRNVSFSENFCV